ncbi:GGDEF domain-containing protein [Candidatus Venteria ishoeyi]|uniref:diguanylate cyclase n=1 Tax=Candidatus Venteria ishoeyi TaxID=1899563 RepID=A0A1H6F6N3_9GAMM|nr:GGDEF domain-containing protein [Candidatus Venteria ishoeyi]SEH05808.1 Response regulator PleD [Candidatus Venteria ishoeyi]
MPIKFLAKNKALLSKIHLFHSVDLESIEVYLEACIEKNIAAHEVLLSPQQQNQHIYILLSGVLQVHLDSLDNPPLNKIEEGECVGEVSIIDSQEPSAYVVAETDVKLLVLSQATIWAMVNVSHMVAKNLLYILTKRLRHGHSVIADGVELQKQLQHHAVVDGLTGIHNRRWFDETISRKIQHSRLSEKALCLVLIDIDYFKSFNDSFGHLAGDRVICAVADVLLNNMRGDDMLARFGGDEFIVALTDTELVQALRIIQRIKNLIGHLSVYDDNRLLPVINITAGISRLEAKDTAASFFKRTDQALYEAKNKGRDCIVAV